MERALATSRVRYEEPHPIRRRIRLMLVDDSTVARAVIARMIESDPAFEISAVAGTAEDAIEALSQVRVDIVILDLEMPGQGGLKLLPRIIGAAAGAKVLIVSTLAEEGAEQTLKALALGAADTLPKPGTGRFNGRFSEVLVGKLKALGYATNSTRVASAAPRGTNPAELRPMPSDPIDCLAIGASTGGIHALGALFHALPKAIGIPILITQHLPATFMPVFARQLGAIAHREALVAEDGMALRPDRIILAPGDASLTLEPIGRGAVVRLLEGRSASGCMPSLDPMFASVGAVYGPAALAVVLTGMGRDGVEGSERLVAAGGSVIAQDETSSAVWGMPRAVLEAGLVSAVLPLDKIARRIAARVEEIAGCK
ncbi:MAG TPA: chemotaxis-specific protein-glutamate methyltransferase CheB [Sphingomicrobium sp.]|nr:chemotaxis-specific protein-glutamate methyltransferase CheB [Sphingomicrobium sp.]